MSQTPEMTSKTTTDVVPNRYVAGTTKGTGMSVQQFQGVVARLFKGNVPAAHTVDAKLQTASVTAAGAAPADGDYADLLDDAGAVVALPQILPATTQKVFQIRVRRSRLKDYVRWVIVTVGATGSDLCASLSGYDTQYSEKSDEGVFDKIV